MSRLGYEVVGIYGVIKQFLTRLIRIFIPPINNVFYHYISPKNKHLYKAITLHRKIVWLLVIVFFSILSVTSGLWLGRFCKYKQNLFHLGEYSIDSVALRALWGGVATYILSFGLTKTAFKLNLGVFLIIIPTYIIFGRSIVSFNVIYLIQVLLLLSLGWWVYYRKYLDLTEYFLPVFSIVFVLIACVNISRFWGLY